MKARELALKVLLDIEENSNYSNIAINKHLKNVDMNNQDRGLATELIYGVIENKYYLDYIIDKLSKIKCKKMNNYVKILLRMGIYQILLLNSISDYAAVNETVSLVKKYDKRSSGFVNAILRNIIRQKDTIGEVDLKDDKIMYLATKYSYKPWIIKNWINNFSLEFTEDLLEANKEKPSLYLRTNTLKISRDELIEKLKQDGINCSIVPTLLFNMLSRFVIAFLLRSKHLLISWLQSPSAVILEPKKIKFSLFPLFPSASLLIKKEPSRALLSSLYLVQGGFS